MKVESFSAMESEVLSLINQNIRTFEDISEKVSFSEKILNQTLETLCSKSILVFNAKTKQYAYDSPVNNEMVVLDGNILLPTTIIRMPEKGFMYVTRGEWYKFPIDFDIRRIIWNIKLVGKNNSTLVEMVRTSVLKERKSKIKHNTQYDALKNKIIPYNKNIGLLINAVGDDVTDVTIQFKVYFDESDPKAPIHRGFTVNTEISTNEMLGELKKPVNERDYVKNIKLNLIYNLSDFLFSKNEIPVSLIDGKFTYIKITGIKKGYELTYYEMGMSGVIKKVDVEMYDNPQEAIEKFREIFRGYASSILLKSNILCEVEQ